MPDTEVTGEYKGKIMGESPRNQLPVSPGRPRLSLDLRLLQEIADLGWGYKRIAAEYSRQTGEYVSHMTVRDRLAVRTPSSEKS